MMSAHVRDDAFGPDPVVFVSGPYKHPRSQLFHIDMISMSPDPGLDAVLSILLSIREENEPAREITSVRSQIILD
jgi:hypothetical protein